MSNTIALRTQAKTDEMVNWAQNMSYATLLPQQYRKNPGNLMYAAEYADALGISRIHVLTSIAVINGKPTATADLMSAMVRAHGHRLRVTGDDTTATAILIRSDDPDFEFTATWDVAKAKKASLWGNKGPWTQYPAAMLRSRAISEVVRMAATDVMAGAIYTPEELGANNIEEDGSVIQMEATQVPQYAPQPAQQPAQQSTPQQAQQAQQRTDNTDQALGEALNRAADVVEATVVNEPAQQVATPLDKDGYPVVATGDQEEDFRLYQIIEQVKAAATNEELVTLHGTFLGTLVGDQAKAFIDALNTRQATLHATVG